MGLAAVSGTFGSEMLNLLVGFSLSLLIQAYR